MQEQIKELLARYVKGECTDGEITLLERWYDQIAMEEGLGRILSAADEERLVMQLRADLEAPEGASQMEAPEGISHNIKPRRRVLRVAAVWAGLIVVTGGVWLQWNRRLSRSGAKVKPAFIEVVTGYQQVRKVVLPDSSVVWLNSATHLAFDPEFETHREVHLSGEAFFDITPDVKHPFVVKAGNASTQVFGTSFNISAYPEAGELRVSLKTGKVRVSYGANEQKVLAPGELLVCNRLSGREDVIQQSPGEMDVWTGGRLLFYKTPLKEALAQIEARYGVHIIYDRPIKEWNITARFENTALEKVLAQLSFGWDLHFARKGDILHVR